MIIDDFKSELKRTIAIRSLSTVAYVIIAVVAFTLGLTIAGIIVSVAAVLCFSFVLYTWFELKKLSKGFQ